MSYIPQSKYLTVKEVSDILKLSVLTIYKYIRERQIEVIRFGGHYRIDKLSLDRFINEHKILENNSFSLNINNKNNL
jgi:excisionase family DNA binding protein